MNWLHIKRRNISEFCVWIICILPFLFGLFLELLKMPTFIKYTLDISWCFLFLTMIVRGRLFQRITAPKMIIWIFMYFLYCLISYISKYQSVFYFLWGVRNNFRFYIFFFACIIFLKKEDIEEYMRVFDFAFYINTALVIIQFFIMGYRRDYLGGIFGTKHGCNGYLNIFLVIISIKSILYFIHKKESLQKCLINLSLIIMTAAFAELKFFS